MRRRRLRADGFLPGDHFRRPRRLRIGHQPFHLFIRFHTAKKTSIDSKVGGISTTAATNFPRRLAQCATGFSRWGSESR
ncbi:hypothetical protein J7M28_10175 [bacterium]|nr:hypothetical protein [bacterium]